MTTATQNATAPETAVTVTAPAVKLSAGEIAVKAVQVKGATNAVLLKAVWSTRGNIRVAVKGIPNGVAVVKADLVKLIQAAAPAEISKFILTPTADGADLKAV